MAQQIDSRFLNKRYAPNAKAVSYMTKVHPLNAKGSASVMMGTRPSNDGGTANDIGGLLVGQKGGMVFMFDF